jgi:hypothetical protein
MKSPQSHSRRGSFAPESRRGRSLAVAADYRRCCHFRFPKDFARRPGRPRARRFRPPWLVWPFSKSFPFMDDSMMRFFALAVAVYCHLAPGLALAEDTARQLAGSWKLTSWVHSGRRWRRHRTIWSQSKRKGAHHARRIRCIHHRGGKSQASGERCRVGSPPQDAHGLHRSIHNRERQVYDQGRHILE